LSDLRESEPWIIRQKKPGAAQRMSAEIGAGDHDACVALLKHLAMRRVAENAQLTYGGTFQRRHTANHELL
jgi:hypothetical protein